MSHFEGQARKTNKTEGLRFKKVTTFRELVDWEIGSEIRIVLTIEGEQDHEMTNQRVKDLH